MSVRPTQEAIEALRPLLIEAMTGSLANDYPHTYSLLARAADTLDVYADALRAIKANAEAWHGPPPDNSESGAHYGHAQALAVIATWCDEALKVAA